jgi:hypothetical protein
MKNAVRVLVCFNTFTRSIDRHNVARVVDCCTNQRQVFGKQCLSALSFFRPSKIRLASPQAGPGAMDSNDLPVRWSKSAVRLRVLCLYVTLELLPERILSRLILTELSKLKLADVMVHIVERGIHLRPDLRG